MSGVDVVAVRRDLHAHPELGFVETRTTAVIMATLTSLGLHPAVLPGGTGVVCDLGSGPRTVALRADIDALPFQDLTDTPYRSTIDGVCHGCGHDAHTAILLGAAAVLAASPLPGRVRLIFQPAEEKLTGGALGVIDAGLLAGVDQIYALHCDPRLDTGRVGLRVGAITAACDHVDVTLRGPGGHTARPQLTVDLVRALGTVITGLPEALDDQALLVWGATRAGSAPNVIPSVATVQGTLRLLDRDRWAGMEAVLRPLLAEVVAATGAAAELGYQQGVPPVVNDAASVEVQRAAVTAALGPEAVAGTEQSMGGEDFAWYLTHVPGAMARLGVRAPGAPVVDLHSGAFDLDEAALDIGVRYTVALALAALRA
ncbi:amidohydrolase [Jatrophihabitans sp.]|uniref:amidohydrolase n=1 Tax=Jatrophihabitans sp. TaxID=1932789 RepID=UPI0030C6C447|nr:amidohydrolase [Jatrophihabitans sp.]